MWTNFLAKFGDDWCGILGRKMLTNKHAKADAYNNLLFGGKKYCTVFYTSTGCY